MRIAPGFHQVDPGQQLVGGIEPFQVLAGDVEHGRQTGAVGDEDRVEFVRELVEGQGLADDHVALDRHPQLDQPGHLGIDDLLGQTELGDAIT